MSVARLGYSSAYVDLRLLLVPSMTITVPNKALRKVSVVSPIQPPPFTSPASTLMSVHRCGFPLSCIYRPPEEGLLDPE